MVKIRVSGTKEAVNVLFDSLGDLSEHGVLNRTNNKEYPNTDGTIRKYIDLDLSNFEGDLTPITSAFVVSLRITSATKDDIKDMLRVLSHLAAVAYIAKGEELITRRKKYGYCVMVTCISKAQVAKHRLLGLKNDDFKIYK